MTDQEKHRRALQALLEQAQASGDTAKARVYSEQIHASARAELAAQKLRESIGDLMDLMDLMRVVKAKVKAKREEGQRCDQHLN